MSIFSRKGTVKLFSEEQKDTFVEKLENAHIKYKIREDRDSVNSGRTTYILSADAADLKKVM